MVCQRTTNAITFLHHLQGYFSTNYVDDFGGRDTPQNAPSAYHALELLFHLLGLGSAGDKDCPPYPDDFSQYLVQHPCHDHVNSGREALWVADQNSKSTPSTLHLLAQAAVSSWSNGFCHFLCSPCSHFHGSSFEWLTLLATFRIPLPQWWNQIWFAVVVGLFATVQWHFPHTSISILCWHNCYWCLPNWCWWSVW